MTEGKTTKKHKSKEIKATLAIITLSDTRTISNDESGKIIKEISESFGNKVVEHIVLPDEKDILQEEVMRLVSKVNVIITNGGTGIAKRDITTGTIEQLFQKKLEAFGPLFAKLSYDDIGSAAILSRATAGMINDTVIFCIPGSPKAVKLAMEKLILPEIGHILKHLGD